MYRIFQLFTIWANTPEMKSFKNLAKSHIIMHSFFVILQNFLYNAFSPFFNFFLNQILSPLISTVLLICIPLICNCLKNLGAVNLIIPFLYEYLSRDYQWMGVLLSNQVGNALGCQMAILLAYFIFTADAVSYAWRYYMFIMIIPLILFVVLVYFFLDESPRYLMSKGKQDKALEILTKMAERNNILMPKQIKLIPDNELAHSDDPKLSLCEKLEIVCKNWDILRCVICLTLMGIASRFIFYGMSFVKTELVYMNGENNSSDYCDGTGSKTYYLDRSDYLLLLFFQVIADFFGAVGVAVVYKMNFAVKPTIMICFTVCIAINACLYLCPVIWAAVLLVSIVYILGCIVSTITWLKLSGLLPTNVRISMFGLCTFMMYFPIPFTPYLIQVFSKESQHLVTTTSLVFISVGFVGSIFLPRQIYAN